MFFQLLSLYRKTTLQKVTNTCSVANTTSLSPGDRVRVARPFPCPQVTRPNTPARRGASTSVHTGPFLRICSGISPQKRSWTCKKYDSVLWFSPQTPHWTHTSVKEVLLNQYTRRWRIKHLEKSTKWKALSRSLRKIRTSRSGLSWGNKPLALRGRRRPRGPRAESACALCASRHVALLRPLPAAGRGTGCSELAVRWGREPFTGSSAVSLGVTDTWGATARIAHVLMDDGA